MRYKYYGAFAPGLEECIAAVLKERFPDLAIPLLLSGAVVFETSLSYDRLNLFCFNNIFRVIGIAANHETGRGPASQEAVSPKTLENFVLNTIRRKEGKKTAMDRPGGGKAEGFGDGKADAGFRVIFSLENIPAAVSGALRGEAENYIASLSGLRVNRSKPSAEFWFLQRREGAFFMRRLSRHRPWDKLLHPGELPPPLAWTLCKLSCPRPGERVADPFCGYGSIPAARLRHFPPAEFFASDTDRHSIKLSKDKFKGKEQHRCVFNCCDVTELPRFIPPASLDSIITDPPWGFYRELSAGDLYARSLAVFSGLLKPGGGAVILCGRADGLRAAAGETGFTIRQNIPILLSGRKAAILVLEYEPGGAA